MALYVKGKVSTTYAVLGLGYGGGIVPACHSELRRGGRACLPPARHRSRLPARASQWQAGSGEFPILRNSGVRICPHFSESRNPEAGLRKSETGTRTRAGGESSAGRDIFTAMEFIGCCVFLD